MKTVNELIRKLYLERVPDEIIVKEAWDLATEADRMKVFFLWVQREIRDQKREEEQKAKKLRGVRLSDPSVSAPAVDYPRPLSIQKFRKHNGQEVPWSELTTEDIERKIAQLRSLRDKMSENIAFLTLLLEKMLEANVTVAGDWDGLQGFLDGDPDQAIEAGS